MGFGQKETWGIHPSQGAAPGTADLLIGALPIRRLAVPDVNAAYCSSGIFFFPLTAMGGGSLMNADRGEMSVVIGLLQEIS
jgi:hypothetical protein